MDELRLDGRHAVVCGSTQGIGEASAQLLAERGARVTLVARNAEALEKVKSALPPTESGEHRVLVADFSEPDTLRSRVEEHIASHGTAHILVNNTGGPPAGPLIDAAPEAFVRALEMHVLCNHHLVQALVPGMRSDGYGRIISVISTSVREPIPNLGVSNTTRGAVASWSKTLSRELGKDGITVNNVLPGFTETGRLASLIATNAGKRGVDEGAIASEMKGKVPLGRFATAREVAHAVTFLASPAAAYISGVSLPVDGGRIASV